MKKLIVNGRFLTQPTTGVQRYAIELLNSWDKLIDKGAWSSLPEIIVAVPEGKRLETNWRKIAIREVGKNTGNVWEQIDLFLASRNDWLFSPCNTGPVLQKNQIVTIHDTSVYSIPQAYSRAFVAKYKFIFRIFAKSLPLLLTDSNFSKNEIVRILHADPEKVDVIHPGVDHILRIKPDFSIIGKHGLVRGAFVFAVASRSPHKNFALIENLSKLPDCRDTSFVFAGGEFNKIFRSSQQDAEQNVTSLGYITDEELRALYETCGLFVFPSLYEGYGLPPMEAAVCGARVLSSPVPSVVELGHHRIKVIPADAVEKWRAGIIDSLPMGRQSPDETSIPKTWENAGKEILDKIHRLIP